ncbi:sigma-70 family RNA polymerase sigma factor [Streptomyces sp. NPDC089919]|uniref:sigma-70 family RNA polymerase sigma factor n=1 Tax=Streptomyces sp. NPDC089919 TaxID=3155188 RepID=UPI0034149ED2
MSDKIGTELVRSAQSGDLRAQDELIAAYLPLVYNIVGRAMNGHHDVDDVVQETMLRALDGLGTLRSPDSFRSWLVAIAMNVIRSHWHTQQAGFGSGPLDEARELADPGADFVDLTVVRLNLSGQRRETAEATRWMEPEDSALLSLWWLECAGELTRHEVAAALELSPQHTAVRVQRMKAQLDASRVVVRALAENPLCPRLAAETGVWDGRPSALWRKRIARHARACAHCSGLWHGLVPAEGLLAGLLLVPPSALLLAGVRDGAGFGLAAAPGAMPSGPATASMPSYGAGPGSSYGAGPGGPGASAGGRGERRRQARGRRRRTAVAAGVAVVALGGGVFYFASGPRQDTVDQADSPRAQAAPASSLTSEEPSAPATPSPSASSAAPSPSPAKSSAAPTPKATPSTKAPAPRTPAPKPRPSRSSGGTSGSSSGSGTARKVIDLVNAERAKAGCGPLTSNSLLTKAAQGHSDDMAARNFFDHTNPDGKNPGDRITAAGYRWSTYGENIAMGQRTAADVMDAWMNSSGHRANILNCSFKEIGIGIHSGGGPYWTQVFGAR